MRRIKLTEEDIVLQNMVKLAFRNPNGGSQFANSVLNAINSIPYDKEFMTQFIRTMKGNLIG